MRESSALRSMRGLLLCFLAETEYDVGTSILNGSYVSTVKECLGYTFINHTAAVEHLGLAYSVGQNKTGRNYMIARMAAYKIGLIYEQGGFGVESSEIEAVRWLDLASKMGNCHAANTLGVFYEKKGSFQFLKYYELGTAVPCSDHRPFNEDKEAQRWGCANAAANLAYHYQTAETMDNKKATVYLDMMFEIGDYRWVRVVHTLN
ncbi:hypothetical protein SARC_04722 [Sphaeroforma arctica JP610]|uniref:Uncharacterized protein n=1 Tax=Sphaeroforma arctica JP610 TaxID=667725 RepID=A0A0L0G2D8_9EUKA|nr:hypothetical protein SARC_04722 [Sphaeroforma arctica JP610]KNC82999.1 hypothetical protein SARC_04722 [Sphaeroforma arctica JP610]|eukprot:XP_014156901.1 hypothetical protein SARC_04722 [Sphaeroforma arctica JP610]